MESSHRRAREKVKVNKEIKEILPSKAKLKELESDDLYQEIEDKETKYYSDMLLSEYDPNWDDEDFVPQDYD